ncbi:MAG: GNAT family N-acetyltransferase [Caulobacterales bacterium]
MTSKDAKPNIMVRPCFEQDLQQVQLIYAHAVTTGTGTFECEVPSLAEMNRRWSKTVGAGWPFLVASPVHDVSRVVGYAYAQQFRERQAYGRTFEDSVYVAPGQEGKGIGSALMGSLLFGLEADGVREVVAVIGDSTNLGSVHLHAKHGFRLVGQLQNVGFKFDRWLDVVIMQRSLEP